MNTQAEAQEITDSIRTTLTLRHEAENRYGHDTIFVTRLPGGDVRACKGIDEAAALVAELEQDPATKAIWTNIQKFKPNSEGRKKANVTAYRNIVIDIDRRIKTDKDGNKVNATDEERAVLLAKAEEINAYMKTTAMGCCHILADSGNGYHLNWCMANVEGIVTPEKSKKDYTALLAGLRKKFESPDVNTEIDASLADETQVVTVWGTWNRKYPDMPDRPQRQSKIIYHSGSDAIFPSDLMMTLDTLRKDAKESGFVGEAAPASEASGGDYPLCTEDWLENHGAEHLIEWGSPFIELIGTESRDDGEYYFYTPCLGHSNDEDGYEHDASDAAKHSAIIEKADGGLAHSCWSQDLTIGGVIHKLEKLKGEKYPHWIFEQEPFDPSLIEGFAEIAELDAPQAQDECSESGEAATAESGGLQYPELAFPYDEVCVPGSILRKKTDEACRGGKLTGEKPLVVDPSLVVEAILTLASALPQADEMLSTRVNRFSCLLAMSRAGKDVAWRRAQAVLGLMENLHWKRLNPVGHSQMIIDLGDTKEPPTKENPRPTPSPGPRRMGVITPELRGVLKMARSEGSKIFEQFCEFYDNNQHQTRDRGSSRLVKMDCRVSWGTSLAIGDGKIEERKFTQAFGDNTNDGIGGRMFWAFSENRIDTRDLEEWKPDTEEQAITLDEFLPLLTYSDKLERHEVTGWEAGAREAYVAIQLGADDYPGAMYGLKKTVLAIALVNLHKTITMDDLRAAEAYIRHQARIRRVFQASQADDGVQAKFNELVIRAVRREDQKMAKKGVAVKDRWINIRRLAQRNEWGLRESRLGLQKTVEALHVAGYISLNSEGDWQRPRAAHVVGADCWCGETHEK